MARDIVVIPWRSTVSRKYAFDIVYEWYVSHFTRRNVLVIDSYVMPFSLAQARNIGVGRASELHHADTVILGDADTIPEVEPLNRAIDGCMMSGLVHLPYTEYRSLREDGTQQFLGGTPPIGCNHFVVNGAVSGVLVTTPETWYRLGGQDERFRGWGYEDASFAHAHKLITGQEMPREKGRVYALHHDDASDKGSSHTQANLDLCRRYLSCKSVDDLDSVSDA